MQIKVHCPCGAKYAFDVEPVHGRMPMPVQCPSCGVDGTELANALIREQLTAAAPPAAAAAPVTPKAAPAPPSPVPRVRLRTAASAAAPEATATAAPAPAATRELCARHTTEPAVEHCRVCGKPICPKCMELHGYVCSVFCRNKAEATGVELPRYGKQRSVVQQTAQSKGRFVLLGVGAVIALLLAGWIWFTFVGSQPRVMYSLPIPKAERGVTYEMLSPTEILVIKERRLALLDIAQGRELWSTPLEAAKGATALERPPATKPAPKPSAGPTVETAVGKVVADKAKAATSQPAEPAAEEEEDEWDFGSYASAQLLTVNGDIWLRFPDRLAAYDRTTGTRKQEVPLKPPVLELTQNESAITAVSGDELSGRTLTWITLPAGTVKTAQLEAPANAAALRARAAQATRALASIATEDDDPNQGQLGPVDLRDDFLAAGPNVVECKVRLLERKSTNRPAMKPKSDKPLLESGRLSAGQSLDAAIELLNDMKRQDSGGVISEDVSRYQITLRRLLGTEAAPWTGEVIGPPALFPLKTVDVLCGAKDVCVFDKSNKKRWEARLSYSISRGFSLGLKDARRFPCVESPDALYVFDEGMLTCFELASGQARWRMNSVGISRVQLDAQGKLYVNSTTASPDLIDFPQQFSKERPQPVIMKVSPANGKVLWKVTSLADDCILSGKYVYAGRASSGLYASGTYFNLYRLSPSDGKQLWHYYQERQPRRTGYHGNRFMVQWKDELQVLKFLSL